MFVCLAILIHRQLSHQLNMVPKFTATKEKGQPTLDTNRLSETTVSRKGTTHDNGNIILIPSEKNTTKKIIIYVKMIFI